MTEKTYKQLKKQYDANPGTPSGEYLCKVPGSGEVVFGRKLDWPIYGIYTNEQNGYKQALERTPVPQVSVCDHCGQELHASQA